MRTAAALLCVYRLSERSAGRRFPAVRFRYPVPDFTQLEHPIAMAAPRKIVSLAHIKAKDEPEPPKPRRIAHHGGAVTTNKPVALLQFLHKKKLKGETLSEDQ